MTKHLRLIMLSLLAMICMGGYSQSETVFKTLSFPDDDNANNKVSAYQTKWTAKIRTDTWSIVNFNNNQWKDWKYIKCGSKKAATIASIATEKAFDAPISKVVVSYGKVSATDKLNKYYLQIASDAAFTKDRVTIDGKLEDSGAFDYTFTIPTPVKGRYFKLVYDIQQTGDNGTIQVDKVVYWQKAESGKTATTLSFKDLVGEGVTLINGKLANGNDFNGYTATEKDNVAGTIAYAASGDGVATVDEKTGAVKVYPNVFGTTTITATFTPGDTKTYAESTASYKVINKDPNAPVDVVFVASVDKGKTTVTGKDEMSKNGVSIQSENAALGNGENYRFYQEIKVGHTFSVKRGFITKIVFEGGTSSYSLKNVKLKDQKNGAITTSSVNKATWEGEAKSVVFTTSGQARATKITVTVKLPVAKDYTLDEEDINVIEDYDNANVTLTRTFYHDNAWNTLCLPFDVADASAAFDGAEIREIDLSKCTGNTIQFVPATEIKAGVPYIIKWNDNVAEAKPFEKTFEGVTLVAEPKPVKVNNDITFTGFYKMTAASELGGTSVAAIGAGSKLFTVGEGKMKGFRAAFVLSSNAQASKYKVVIDGTATGIEDLVIDSAKANGRVYNLNGQYVGNSLNGLQPGLYIQNGKKIVVK